MIDYISSWARQVILAVLIAIILEMILLKESKMTKYIKTVIGIYVMYVIIAPGLNLLNGKSLDFSNIDYEKYLQNSNTYKKLENSVENAKRIDIKDTYVLKLKEDIENKLKDKGYIASNIELEVNMNLESEDYGLIKRIQIILSQENNNSTNKISVNKININTSKQAKNESEDEKYKMLKEFLSNEYGVDINNIEII